MKNLTLLLVFVFILGCERKENTIPQERINSATIKNLITEAIDSNTASNDRLANLIDFSLPLLNNYNSIIVDSLIAEEKTYYYILLENSNPVYNRFAVYDSLLTPLLKDESLSGNLSLEKIKSGEKDFFKIDEAYLSKDTLVLNRLSLYLADLSGVSLVFRTHTKFAKPETEFFQDIIELSDSLIRTKISSSERSPLNNKEDNFIYNPTEKKYSSSQNLFDDFVKKEIESFKNNPVKEQLTDSTVFFP